MGIVQPQPAAPAPTKPAPYRAPKRRPIIDGDAATSNEPVDVAAMMAEGGDDAMSAMAEAERRDQEQVEAELAAKQQKRRAAARARQGLPPEEDEEVAEA